MLVAIRSVIYCINKHAFTMNTAGLEKVSLEEFERRSFRPLWVAAGLGTWYDRSDMSLEDQKAIGWHQVLVPEHLDDAAAAAFALGIFHNTVAIENVSVFEYQVFDEDEDELEPDADGAALRLADRYDGLLFAYERGRGVYRRRTSGGWVWEDTVRGWQPPT